MGMSKRRAENDEEEGVAKLRKQRGVRRKDDNQTQVSAATRERYALFPTMSQFPSSV